jgi:hypothetical protein
MTGLRKLGDAGHIHSLDYGDSFMSVNYVKTCLILHLKHTYFIINLNHTSTELKERRGKSDVDSTSSTLLWRKRGAGCVP